MGDYYNDSSSTNSDDEFIIDVLRRLPTPRVFQDRSDALTYYNDIDFTRRFR